MKNEKIEIQKVHKYTPTLVKVLSFFKLSKAGNTKAGTLNAFGNHLRHRVYIGPYRLPWNFIQSFATLSHSQAFCPSEPDNFFPKSEQITAKESVADARTCKSNEFYSRTWMTRDRALTSNIRNFFSIQALWLFLKFICSYLFWQFKKSIICDGNKVATTLCPKAGNKARPLFVDVIIQEKLSYITNVMTHHLN